MEENSWIWILKLIGRLHPLVVHFPIALLVVALFLEGLTLKGKRPGLREGINWMVYLGAFFALLSAGFGWFLRVYDDYSGDLVMNHQNLGIITAVFAISAAFLLFKNSLKPKSNYLTYRIVLLITVIFVAVTGHLGANLTHGEDYLYSVLPGNMESYDNEKAGVLLAQLNSIDSLSTDQNDALNLEVRAIFAHNCTQCHGENKQKGDLVLENKRGVYNGGESGKVIVPGSADESELYRRITLPINHDEVMPKKGKVLKKIEIDLIKLWINNGAHWADKALKIFPEAALALEKPTLPDVPSQTHSVDKLVSHYFQEHKIKFPQLVDDRTFIRRVFLDVIGLLPSIKDIEAFEIDSNEDKRLKLIDTLLNDNQNYTQHWLSFWNDLLRNDYSGTGYITGGRMQITDWLYQSLMSNKPYSEMVKELVNPNDKSKGFIKGIKWRGVVNASQRTEMQAAQNIGQALLGVNVKCASCHNSFVSNLTLEQSYGFASVFSDSILELNRCDKPLGKMATVNFLYPELGSVDAPTLEGRLEKLSEVMVKPENGRLYRTITNRIWKRLIGRGLIEPMDMMDNQPWDSNTLDWLSADFVDSGFDIKHLIRTILSSKVYQLPAVNYEDGALIKSDKYVFEGPVIRRLSAEQFSDAVSQVIAPVYYATAYNPDATGLPINRFWHRERKFDRDVLPDPGTRYFRNKFSLTKLDIESAQILISVDHSYTLYLNGKSIATGENWKKVSKIDIKKYLKEGENIIAIEGVNEGPIPNPAGVLFALQIKTMAGEELKFDLQKSWKSAADKPETDWTSLSFDTTSWESAKNFGSRHWGRLINFSFQDKGNVFARASMVKQHSFMKALGRPSRENISTTRDDQATLLQALELTNGIYFNTVLEEGATHWLAKYEQNPEKIVDTLYREALGRMPTNEEKSIMLRSLGRVPDKESVHDLFWATLLLPEFQFIY